MPAKPKRPNRRHPRFSGTTPAPTNEGTLLIDLTSDDEDSDPKEQLRIQLPTKEKKIDIIDWSSYEGDNILNRTYSTSSDEEEQPLAEMDTLDLLKFKDYTDAFKTSTLKEVFKTKLMQYVAEAYIRCKYLLSI